MGCTEEAIQNKKPLLPTEWESFGNIRERKGAHLKLKHMRRYIYGIQVYFGSSLHSCWDFNHHRQRYNTAVGQPAIREEGPCGAQQFTGCYLSLTDATVPNFNCNPFLILSDTGKGSVQTKCRYTNAQIQAYLAFFLN